MSNAYEHTPNPDRADIHEWISALPPTGDGSLLDAQAAAAAFFDLQRAGSSIPTNVTALSKRLYEETAAELEVVPEANDMYVVTSEMLRGIIAKAALLGGAQASLQIGEQLSFRRKEIADLEKLFNANNDGNNDTSPDEPASGC